MDYYQKNMKIAKIKNNLIKIAVDLFPHQKRNTRMDQYLGIAIYTIRKLFTIAIMIILTAQLPLLTPHQNTFLIIFISFIILRVSVALIYILNPKRSLFLYFLSQILQISTLFIFFVRDLVPVICLQLIADLVYVICKPIKKGSFDSGISYSNTLIAVLLSKIQILAFILVLDESYQSKQNMVTFLLLLNLFYVIVSLKNSFFNAKTKTIILRGNIMTTIIVFYFKILWWLFGQDFQPASNDYQFILIPSCLTLLLQIKFMKVHINTKILSKNPQKLSIKGKKQLIMEAINYMEDSKLLTRVQRSQMMYQHKNNCEQFNCHLCLADPFNEIAFTNNFRTFIRKQLIKLVKIDKDFLYLALGYFYNQTGSFLKKFLNAENFFERRMISEIEGDDWEDDLQEKLGRIGSKDQQIYNKSLEYLIDIKTLLNKISRDNIDLNECYRLSEKLLNGFKWLNNLGSRQNREQNLSQLSLQILNIMKRQVFMVDAYLKQDKGDLSSFIINQQDGILLVCADEQNLGSIIGANRAFLKLTSYTESELVSNNIAMLQPPEIHQPHKQILKDKLFNDECKIDNDKGTNIFLLDRNGNAIICDLKTKFADGISQKKWVVKLKDISHKQTFIIIDHQSKIVAYTYKVGQIYNAIDVKGQFSPPISNQFTEFCIISTYLTVKSDHKIPMELQYRPQMQISSNSSILPQYMIFKINHKTSLKSIKTDLQIYQNPNRFQFSYNLSNIAFSHKQADQNINSRFTLTEDVNELVYLNGGMEFRENLFLEQNNECETHPFAKKYTSIKKNKKDLGSKDELLKLIENKNKQLRVPKIVLLMIVILIGLVSLGFMISLNIVGYQSLVLEGQKNKFAYFMHLRIVKYMKIGTLVSGPMWESLRYHQISAFVTQIGQAQSLFDQIAQLDGNIDSIVDISGKWNLITFSHIIASNQTYQQLFTNLRLEFQDMSQLSGAELQKQQYIKTVKVFRQITTVNKYIYEQTIEDMDKKIESRLQLIQTLMIIWIIVCLGLGAVYYKTMMVINYRLSINMCLLGYFTHSEVENYVQKVEKVTNAILLDQYSQIENDLSKCQNRELLKKKRSTYSNTGHRIRNLSIFLAIGIIMCIILNLKQVSQEQNNKQDALKHFSSIYIEHLIQLQIIWFDDIITKSQPSVIGLTTQQVGILDNYTGKKLTDEQQRFHHEQYGNQAKLQSGAYSYQFIRQYRQKILGDYCKVMQTENCSNVIVDYELGNIADYIQAISLLTEGYVLGPLSVEDESNVLDILRAFTQEQEKIVRIGQNMVIKQNGRIVRDTVVIIAYSIAVVIGACAAFGAIMWMMVKKEIGMVIKSMEFLYYLFPIDVLNSNIVLCAYLDGQYAP